MGTVHTPTPEGTLDADGISIVTTTRSGEGTRQGLIYDPTFLAAAAPVYVHPLTPGRYLVSFSRRWYDATASETEPGSYATGYSEDTNPGWVIVDHSGSRTPVGRDFAIPGPDGRTLRAGYSTDNNYLYLLSSLGDEQGVIQHFRWSPDRDRISLLASETMALAAAIEPVRFDGGLYVAGANLVVIGVGQGTGSLYLARKPWGRIGVSSTYAQGPDSMRVDDPTWSYYTGEGWSRDISDLTPLPITTAGPVSVAVYRDQTFLSVVETDGDDRIGAVWVSKTGGTWTRQSESFPLGSVADNSYLGGTAQLQPMLRSTGAAMVGVPLLTAVGAQSEGEHRINVSWDTWTVIS